MQLSGWFSDYDPSFADIKNDWIVADALLSGDNPYRDLHSLTNEYAPGAYEPPGEPGTELEPTRTPRTPGAIVLAIPWTLLDIEEATQWNNLLSVFLTIPILGTVLWKRGDPLWLFSAVAMAWCAPMLWNLKFSNVSAIVALFIAWYVLVADRSDSGWAGVPIAFAATLKVFPAILIVYAAVRRRWRTVIVAALGLIVLNLGPVLLPEVRLVDAVDALFSATSNFGFSDFNVSFGYPILDSFDPLAFAAVVLVALVGVLAWVSSRHHSVAVDGLLILSLATVLVPISWPHYALFLIPFVLTILIEGTTHLASRGVIVAGLLLMVPTDIPWLTQAGVALFVVAAVTERLINPPSQPQLPRGVPASAH